MYIQMHLLLVNVFLGQSFSETLTMTSLRRIEQSQNHYSRWERHAPSGYRKRVLNEQYNIFDKELKTVGSYPMHIKDIIQSVGRLWHRLNASMQYTSGRHHSPASTKRAKRAMHSGERGVIQHLKGFGCLGIPGPKTITPRKLNSTALTK